MSELANNFIEPVATFILEGSLRLVESVGDEQRDIVDVGKKLGRNALVHMNELQDEPPGDDESDYEDVDDGEIEKVAGIVLSDDPVRDYLKHAGREPLLNAVQEVELSRAIEVGVLARERYDGIVDDTATSPQLLRELRELEYIGNKAKERMIKANLRLVVNVAKRYTGKGLSFLDVIQEGNLGMMHAVDMFDYTKGYKFSTYATLWIRQTIKRSIGDKGREIRLPVHLDEKITAVLKQRRDLLIELGHDPSDQEIADEVGITVEILHNYMGYISESISLNMKIGDDQTAEFGDLIEDKKTESPEAAADKIDFESHMHRLISGLSENEAYVLRQHMGIDTGQIVPLQEIGEILGLTREAVRQIEKRALKKLHDTPGLLDQLREYR